MVNIQTRGQRRRGSKGFTLIELLVVVAILGVMATIAVFSLSGFSDASGDAACRADHASLTDAEDTAMAAQGEYLSEDALVAAKYLKNPVASYDVTVTNGGTGYTLTQVGSCELAFGGGSGVGDTSPSTVPPSSTTSSTTTTSTTTTSTTTTSTTTTTTTLADTTPPAVTIGSCSVNGSKKWSASGSRGTAAGDLPLVTITVSGPTPDSDSTSAGGGSWSVGPNMKLNPGTYTCTARQSDNQGNVGTATKTLVVT